MRFPDDVLAADSRIRPFTRETYLERSPYLSEAGGADVWVKCEHLQHTGSFKARGAMNKVLALTDEERAAGVVTASTGNHGLAVARAAREVGVAALVFVPVTADQGKVAAIGSLGAEVRTHADDSGETEVYARAYAAEHAMAYVSPYNDPLVIAGQGTVGLELTRQLGQFDAVFVALGGGGLISGVAGYLKSVGRAASVVGCSPENSAVMIRSVKAGRILDLASLPTLSDGTAGGVEAGAMTFDLCRTLVDTYVTVSEDAIRDALRGFVAGHRQLIEGSAAMAIASFLDARARWLGARVVIVLCGGNISAETLRAVL
jgi:threonine dehydratase